MTKINTRLLMLNFLILFSEKFDLTKVKFLLIGKHADRNSKQCLIIIYLFKKTK